MVTIREIAEQNGFTGSRYHRHADFTMGQQYTIDESSYGPTVNTSVDCYVTGIYIGAKGNSISVKRRYTVYVSYTRSTQMTALNKIRSQIMTDFEQNFPQFKISDVFIPENMLPIPQQQITSDESADQFYGGSNLYRRISSVDVGQFQVGTEKEIYKSRVAQIKKKYGLR
jgi:hypothetical protein